MIDSYLDANKKRFLAVEEVTLCQAELPYSN